MTAPRRKRSVVILIPYFGSWPEWIDLFFETARRNTTIDFLVFTDCDADAFAAPNIQIRPTSFADYVQRARSWLGLPFDPPDGYKLCDLRPMFGALHEKEFSGYDFYGWCDTDLLFGDIRRFYTNQVLERFDVLSTHADRISGHFALFRNTPRNRLMYRKVYRWQQYLLEPEFIGLDEHGITNAYVMTGFDKIEREVRLGARQPRDAPVGGAQTAPTCPRRAVHNAVLPKPWLDGSVDSAQPHEWFYRDGHVTNSRDGDREFLYLHLMNFKSSRWRHDGTRAPWEGDCRICQATPHDMRTGIVDRRLRHRAGTRAMTEERKDITLHVGDVSMSEDSWRLLHRHASRDCALHRKPLRAVPFDENGVPMHTGMATIVATTRSASRSTGSCSTPTGWRPVPAETMDDARAIASLFWRT